MRDAIGEVSTEVRLPARWLVSATNACPGADPEAERLPYGTRHARQVGSRLTECGAVATEWPIFWGLPFLAEDRASCPDCAARLASSVA